MAFVNEQDIKIVLLTGSPGVGKTTLLKQVVQSLQDLDKQSPIKIRGFVTEDLRDQYNTRYGFDIVDIANSDNRAPFARLTDFSTMNATQPKVGKYSVMLESFEKIALPIVDNTLPKCIYAIDEIGKMELLSIKFNSSIRRLMHEATCGNIFLLATIPLAKGKPLVVVEELKAHSKAIIFTINHENRNNLLNKIVKSIKPFC